MRILLLVLALATATAAADSKIPVYSTWTGTYFCAQGITNVRLTIETSINGGAAFGHFEFSANEANKSVPSGSYWLQGAMHTNADGKLEVTLRPDCWGTRPTGYVMVGLTVTSDREQRGLAGQIDYPSCSTIAVRRVDAEAE